MEQHPKHKRPYFVRFKGLSVPPQNTYIDLSVCKYLNKSLKNTNSLDHARTIGRACLTPTPNHPTPNHKRNRKQQQLVTRDPSSISSSCFTPSF